MGRKHTESTKEKIRQSRLGKKRKPFSKIARKNMSIAHLGNTNSLGFKHSEKTKEKHRIKMKGNQYRLGIKHSEETKKKIKKSCKGGNTTSFKIGQTLGSKHWNWKGGITPLHSLIRASAKYKKWREAVFKRDNYTCQRCGDKKGRNLEAHHAVKFSILLERYNIKTLEDADKCYRLWSIISGKTLCKKCHKLTHKDMINQVDSLVAIDPGSNSAGIAVFKQGKLVYSEQLNFKASDSFYVRLRALKQAVASVFLKFDISSFCAIETPFIGQNPQVGLKLGQARGIILALAFDYDVKIIDISPQETRSYYGVKGNAKKEDYQKIVKLEFAGKKILGEDEADAIAVGATALCKIKNARFNKLV
jgi:crossover junction endodeoxyribonuclease RuvC